MQPGQVEGGTDLGEFLDEALDGPQGEIVGAFGPAAAQLVVENDLPPAGERLERFQVVVGEAGAAVQAEQGGPVVPRLPQAAVPDPAAGDLDVALLFGHAWVTCSAAAGTASSSKTCFISGSRAGCLRYR